MRQFVITVTAMWMFLLVLLCLLDLHGFCSGHTKFRKTVCHVTDDFADCSHLSLRDIPTNLPANLTRLDLSHNQLKVLNVSALSRYALLQHLDAGYNSLPRLGVGLCLALPLLRRLHMQHNVIYLLEEVELHNCTHLTELNLASNRLKLVGDPFLPLQNLTLLDVSVNGLTSAKLGTQSQLWRLEDLSLSGNKISVLKNEDFSWLSNSSLQVLRMMSLPLKQVEPGSLKPIRGMTELVLDGSKLGLSVTAQLCQELSGSGIRQLSLQNVQLVSLNSTVFRGLQDTQISSLDLSNNNMNSIGNGSFHWLSTLRNLSLERNSYHHLTRDTFSGLQNLSSLNLRWALVKRSSTSSPIIDDYTFQHLRSLESLWLDHTNFRNISAHTFSGLKSLRSLSLSWSSAGLNLVTKDTFASLTGSPLQILNLTGADINHLDDEAFASLGNLTMLLLSHNFISQSLSQSVFKGLTSIQDMSLSFNNQKIKLTSSSFVNVPTLKTLMLRLAIDKTLDLEPSPFLPLGELLVLDLSNNNIANINSKVFKSLGKLKVLRLQHNNLARFWKSANPGGPILFLQGLENLTELELDNNGFDEIPVEGFQGLQKLQKLSLAGNVLNVLHSGAFDDLVSLRSLNLQKNLITSVPQVVFQPVMRNLTVLYMDRNPFDCTCDSILWFVGWLNTTNASVPERDSAYICNTPPSYFSRSVTKFDGLPCKDMTPFQALFVLSSTMLLAFMVTAFTLRFQGWRMQFYWKVLVSRTLGFADMDMGEDRFQYDAYVIHAPKDRKWVSRHLLPLEAKNFKFCLEDRDFAPGATRLESIEQAMRESRKIVFIVTETLLKDPWCTLYKAHRAIHQVIEDSRDSVVLVFVEDVPDHRLSRAILLRRGMLKPRCLLHWPPDRERWPAFRLSLQVALGSTNQVRQN